jgi:hypothetical protein
MVVGLFFNCLFFGALSEPLVVKVKEPLVDRVPLTD